MRFGDAEWFPQWREVARNEKSSATARIEAIVLLGAGRDPELGTLARELLAVPALQPAAVTALRQHPGAETAEAIVPRLAGFPLTLRNEAINLLAAKPESALVLLKAVDAKTLPSSLVSPVLIDQFARFKNPDIDTLIAKNWVRGGGRRRPRPARRLDRVVKKKLSPNVLAKADASRGRQTFTMTAAPATSSSAKASPSVPISRDRTAPISLPPRERPRAEFGGGKDYLLHVFSMKDGSTLSGMVRGETPEFAKLALPAGRRLM